jgi:hypothetical protein
MTWQERFDQQLGMSLDPALVSREDVKSFISQELAKAREEGKREQWKFVNLDEADYVKLIIEARQEERSRILQILEGMKSTKTNSSISQIRDTHTGWNQALEAIKNKLNN